MTRLGMAETKPGKRYRVLYLSRNRWCVVDRRSSVIRSRHNTRAEASEARNRLNAKRKANR